MCNLDHLIETGQPNEANGHVMKFPWTIFQPENNLSSEIVCFPVLCLTKLTLSSHFRFIFVWVQSFHGFPCRSCHVSRNFLAFPRTIILLHGKTATVCVHPHISVSFYVEFHGNNISTWNSERRVRTARISNSKEMPCVCVWGHIINFINIPLVTFIHTLLSLKYDASDTSITTRNPFFEFIRDFMHVLVTCKFKKDWIKNNREKVEKSFSPL